MEVMAKLSVEVHGEWEEHDAGVVEIVYDEVIVASGSKFCSCTVVVCLMSSLSNFMRGRQTLTR